MAEETKKLAEAFAAKSEVEGYLANLEKLKADGSITEGQYTATREEYYGRLGAATSEIARIKNEFEKQLETNQRDTETSRQELGNLEVKHKVGELPLEEYQDSERKLRAKIGELERYSEELKSVIEASSSADIGAPAKKRRAAAPQPSPPAKPAARAKKPRAAAPQVAPSAKAGIPAEVAAPAKVVTRARKTKLPWGRPLAIVGGVVGVIVVVVVGVGLLTPGDKDGAGLPPGGYETGWGLTDIPVNADTPTTDTPIPITDTPVELNAAALTISRIEVCSGPIERDECRRQPDRTFYTGDLVAIWFETTGFEVQGTGGNCEVWVQWRRYSLYAPDGRVIMTDSNVHEWHEFPPSVDDIEEFHGWWNIGQVETSDPLGEYRVEIEIGDKLSGEVVTKTTTFTLK